MDETLYQEFLDWLRRRYTHVTLRLEDGSVLARGCRPRTAWEELDAIQLAIRNLYGARMHIRTLGYLRTVHGPSVDEFLSTIQGR